MTIDPTDRRTVLRGVAVIGAGVALAACGAGGSTGPSPTGGSSTSDMPAAGTSVGKSADVPVGSGKIFADQKVVVTQLTAGDFKAYSAVCTHQGCIVSSIDKSEIHCACHGSAYSIKDGSVVTGPATTALASETVTDKNGTLTLG